MRMHISKDIARLKLQEYDNDTLINYILANSPVNFEKLDEIQRERGSLVLHGFDSEETIAGNGVWFGREWSVHGYSCGWV